MKATVWFGGPRDWDRLSLFDEFDVIGAGSPADVPRLKEAFPNKIILIYFAPWDQTIEEAADYPGPICKYVATGNWYQPWNRRHVGFLSQLTVNAMNLMLTDRLAACGGAADGVFIDNASPKWCPWEPGVDFNRDGLADSRDAVWTNWRQWIPRTMAAFRATLGERLLVCNVGHSCAEEQYAEYVASLNGIGIEYSYNSVSFYGNYKEPFCHMPITNDLDAWTAAQRMYRTKRGVYPTVMKYVLIGAE